MSTTQTKPKHHHKVDWDAALLWFCRDGSRTYPDVARKFKVSLTRVKVVGKEKGWLEHRRKFTEKLENEVRERQAVEVDQRNRKHIDQYRRVQGFVMGVIERESRYHVEGVPVDAAGIRALVASLKSAADGERVALGLPTTHEKQDRNVTTNDPWQEVPDDQLDNFVGRVQANITRRLHEREKRASTGSASRQGTSAPAGS